MCVAEALSVILRYPLGGKALIELGLFIVAVAGETIGKVIVGYETIVAFVEILRVGTVITAEHPDRKLNVALEVIDTAPVDPVGLVNLKYVVPISVTRNPVFNSVFPVPESTTQDPNTMPCPEGTVAVLLPETGAAIEVIAIVLEVFPV